MPSFTTIYRTAVMIAVRRRRITQLLISGGRTADNSGPSWLTPRSQRVRASLNVAAANITAFQNLPFRGTFATFTDDPDFAPSDLSATLDWGNGQTSTGVVTATTGNHG